MAKKISTISLAFTPIRKSYKNPSGAIFFPLCFPRATEHALLPPSAHALAHISSSSQSNLLAVRATATTASLATTSRPSACLHHLSLSSLFKRIPKSSIRSALSFVKTSPFHSFVKDRTLSFLQTASFLHGLATDRVTRSTYPDRPF